VSLDSPIWLTLLLVVPPTALRAVEIRLPLIYDQGGDVFQLTSILLIVNRLAEEPGHLSGLSAKESALLKTHVTWSGRLRSRVRSVDRFAEQISLSQRTNFKVLEVCDRRLIVHPEKLCLVVRLRQQVICQIVASESLARSCV